jgi:membrane protease YdiL (CAAX protease family)
VANFDESVNLPDSPRYPPVGGPTAPPPGDPFAEALRGFRPIGILAMLLIFAGNAIVAPLSAVLVLLWARRSRTPWHELGYVRPRSWTRTVAAGLVFGVVLKLVMKAIVMPLLGAEPINQAYQHLVGNLAALPGMLFAVTVGAGFGEETLFRGYLFERLGRLLGRSLGATSVIVVLTSALFGLLHYPEQGLAGVQQATIVGFVYGTIYALTRRIWMVMVAHAAFDVTAVAIIYFGLEVRVAQLVFR